MAAMGSFELLFLLLFSFSADSGAPPDALGALDPAATLTLLGYSADADSVTRILTPAEQAVPATGKLSKSLEGAIQNLASRSDEVRAAARKKLVEVGESIVGRLKDVQSKDARRSEELGLVLTGIANQTAQRAQSRRLAQTAAMRWVAAEGEKNTQQAQHAEAIEALVDSEDVLLAWSAKNALIRLKKIPAPAPAETTARKSPLLRELEALPKKTSMVLTTNLAGGSPGMSEWATLGGYMNQMIESMRQFGGAEMEEMLKESLEESRGACIRVLRRVGNFRPESVALTHSGQANSDGGGLALFVEGVYDRERARAALLDEEFGFTKEEVGGADVFRMDGFGIVLLSDRTVLLLLGEGSREFPLEDYLKAHKAGGKALLGNERIAKFLETIKAPFHLRGLLLVDDLFVRAISDAPPPGLQDAFDSAEELELTGKPQADKKKTEIRIEGLFKKSSAAKSTVEYVDQGAKQLVQTLEPIANSPMGAQLKTVLEVLKTLQVSAEGKRAILRASISSDLGRSFLMTAGTSVREN